MQRGWLWSHPVWPCIQTVIVFSAGVAAPRHHLAVLAAMGAGLWALWPAVFRSHPTSAPRAGGAVHVRVRYLGGHPALQPRGTGWLTVWPMEGAAALHVGRASIAFPVAAVQAVSLADGRIELQTGTRGPLAALLGRLRARRAGRFCGLRRAGAVDVAIIDRSRVVCDLDRNSAPCRVILTGPTGGGEEIYLEALVLLRPGITGAGRDGRHGTFGGR